MESVLPRATAHPDFSDVRFKITNLKLTGDRSFIWKLTKERYYAVPVIRDGRNIVFETGEDSQVIGKYLDQKLKLGLFPRRLEGEQSIIWRYIENDIEGLTFKLNDALLSRERRQSRPAFLHPSQGTEVWARLSRSVAGR